MANTLFQQVQYSFLSFLKLIFFNVAGGWFEKVSCANYLGEIVEMWGYAIASLAPPAIAHALFTTLFLTRRALHHHE